MTETLTQFEPDSDRLLVLQECMDNYDVGSDDAEWPNNILSRKTIVFGSGLIARRGEVVQHRVDASELKLCKRLSEDVCEIMVGSEVGMGSESGDPFRAFFIAANVDDEVPERITADLIRSKFRGTLFPPVTITVEPLEESGIWWSEVLYDASDYDDDEKEECLTPWRSMIQWFHKASELSSPVFVRIGDPSALESLQSDQYPVGTEITGSVLPRMAVALSRNGSLIGISGYVVRT